MGPSWNTFTATCPPTCQHPWSAQTAKEDQGGQTSAPWASFKPYRYQHRLVSDVETFSSIKKISISFILQVEKTTEPGCYTSNVPLFVSGWKSSQKVWLPVRVECMINACTTTKSIALSNPPQCPSAKRGLAAPVNRSERLWIWDWTDCIITRSRARTRAHAHSHTHVNAYMIPINVYLKFCLSWGLIRTYAKGSKCV